MFHYNINSLLYLCSFLAVLSLVYITVVVMSKYFLIEKDPSILNSCTSERHIEL